MFVEHAVKSCDRIIEVRCLIGSIKVLGQHDLRSSVPVGSRALVRNFKICSEERKYKNNSVDDPVTTP